MDTKKKHNSNNITNWIFTFSFLVLATAIIFNYINFNNNNPTIQITAMFIAEILITVIFILLIWLDSIQQELYDIKNSLDDLYDLKQVNGVRSTVNKRHIEELLNDICALEEKQNE